MATSALYKLSDFLYRYYGKKVIILLDEYDTPMQEAYVQGFGDELVSFMRSLFNSTFKTNPYLERGLMTGITRVSKLIREGDRRVKTTFEKLLKGETVACPIDEQIVYNQLDGNEAAIWSLLLASGYLKVLDREDPLYITDGRRPNYELALTNYEVRCMFLSMVQDWFNPAKGDYNDFVEALLTDNVDAMNEYMNRVALQTFSYFDVASNRESGFSRYDVVIEPKNKEGYAIILEFKVFNPKREHSLEDTVQSALAQIEEKQYESALTAKGIPAEYIRKYGFAFEGKKVLIG